MADRLTQALMAAQYSPATNAYGIGAQAIGAASPYLYNPYGSTGRNVGAALGSSLVAGLLGGMAQNQADSRNQELYRKASELYSAPAGRRAQLIEESPRLSSLGLALQADERDLQSEFAKEQHKRYVDMLQEQGMIIGGDGQPQQLFDPILTKRQEAAATKLGGLEAESAFYGSDPSKNPSSPQYKIQQDIKDMSEKRRKEFESQPVVQALEKSEIGFRSLVKAAKDPNAASDQELVRGAIQAIEPGMAVREGEAAAIQNSQALPAAWKGSIEAAFYGKARLQPEIREGIMRIAARRYDEYANAYNQVRTQYSGLAEREELPPENVVLRPVAPAVTDIYPEYDPSIYGQGSRAQGGGSVPEMTGKFSGFPQQRTIKAPDGRIVELVD